MPRKFLIALVVSGVFFSCGWRDPSIRTVSLTRDLAYTEVVPDTQVIRFGTPEARPYLFSGWSNPERQGSAPFQWAVEQNPVFIFKTIRRGPLYLHLRTSSFYPNSAEVLVNRTSIGSIQVDREPGDSVLSISESLLAQETNAVEFRFAELRLPENKNDTRRLAAAFHYAIITPSRYAGQLPGTLPKEGLWKTETLLLQGKKRSVLAATTGQSWFLHEKLKAETTLRFGMEFQPSPVSEVEDFAAFSVTLRREGLPEQQIFSRRLTAEGSEQVDLPLDSFLSASSDSIAQIEMRIDRNSIFDSGTTAWIEPRLVFKDHPDPEPAAEIDSLRRNNRGANVVFIILDAAGAKHFGSYGYFRDTTPVLDALAEEGILFEQAYTQAVYTLASTASLMSGLDPLHHRIITRKSRLPAETITLAERFDSSGYSTGTFVANGNASGIFGMTQGFDEVAEVFRDPNYTGWAMDVTNRFIGWLDRHPKRPFFAYLHYREPHGPFNPPEKWKFKFTDPDYNGIAAQEEDVRRAINYGEIESTQADIDYITALYDANLNYGDYEVGRVLSKLKSLGIYDNTIVIVTSDHGEAFWEHNFQGHNSQLYQESVHIPLVAKLTRRSGISGKRVDGFVRTIDFYPTLVDLLGLSQRDMSVDGRSAVPAMVSARDDGRPVIMQTIMEQQYAYREGPYKYMVRLSNRAEELYDLERDPGETRNLILERPVHARYFRSRLLGWLAESRRLGAFQKSERAIVDENTRENLKALGYIDE